MGLLEAASWSRENCMAFVSFIERHANESVAADLKKRDCDKQRAELQKEFNKAYKELHDLLHDAQDRAADKACYENADAEKAAALVPLTSQREQASARIE